MQLAAILARTGGAVIMPKETLHPRWLLYELAAPPPSSLSKRKVVLSAESPPFCLAFLFVIIFVR